MLFFIVLFLGDIGNARAYSYAYLPNSDLLQTTTSSNGTTRVLISARKWEFGTRLKNLVNTVGSTPVTSDSYVYDALGRRTHACLQDGSLWMYGYNDRDELIRGYRYWQEWSPVTGQPFEYNYDPIGNRTSGNGGGDVNGANLRGTTYTANNRTNTRPSSRPATRILRRGLGAQYDSNRYLIAAPPIERVNISTERLQY